MQNDLERVTKERDRLAAAHGEDENKLSDALLARAAAEGRVRQLSSELDRVLAEQSSTDESRRALAVEVVALNEKIAVLSAETERRARDLENARRRVNELESQLAASSARSALKLSLTSSSTPAETRPAQTSVATRVVTATPTKTASVKPVVATNDDDNMHAAALNLAQRRLQHAQDTAKTATQV